MKNSCACCIASIVSRLASGEVLFLLRRLPTPFLLRPYGRFNPELSVTQSVIAVTISRRLPENPCAQLNPALDPAACSQSLWTGLHLIKEKDSPFILFPSQLCKVKQ
jgi:hypothetical protein